MLWNFSTSQFHSVVNFSASAIITNLIMYLFLSWPDIYLSAPKLIVLLFLWLIALLARLALQWKYSFFCLKLNICLELENIWCLQVELWYLNKWFFAFLIQFEFVVLANLWCFLIIHKYMNGLRFCFGLWNWFFSLKILTFLVHEYSIMLENYNHLC